MAASSVMPRRVGLHIEDGVGDGAQGHLPVGEQQGRVIGAVAQVHHHLLHVDRPALREHAVAEDRADERWRPARPGALEVVAGHALVDAQQPEHPVVVLAHVGLDRLRGRVIGGRRDEEVALEPLVERAGRVEERAAVGAHEDRCPDDGQRLVGETDDARVPAEGLDARHLVAAPVEQVGRLLVLGRRWHPGPAGPGLPRRPRRPARPRGAAHPAPTSTTAPAPAGASPPRTAAWSRHARSSSSSGVMSLDSV